MNYQRYLELIAVILEEFGEAVQAGNNYFWKGQGDLEAVWREFRDMRSPLDELIRRLETAKEEER